MMMTAAAWHGAFHVVVRQTLSAAEVLDRRNKEVADRVPVIIVSIKSSSSSLLKVDKT